MRDTDIKDSDIPGADPAAVVAQYEPLIKKTANRYTRILEQSGAVGLEDLHQVARMAILQAQKQYNPAAGMTFLSFVYNPIRWAMLRALGFNPNTWEAPAQLVYLDEPLPGGEEADTTRLDMIEDESIRPFDEPLMEAETREETAAAVRDALGRMKSEKQRQAVSLVWLEGNSREQAAEQMEMKPTSFRELERHGRERLRRDAKLRAYVANSVPFVHVGVSRFNTTWTSSTEWAVLWREQHLPQDPQEQAAEDFDTGRGWTPAQTLAYMRRLVNKHRE